MPLAMLMSFFDAYMPLFSADAAISAISLLFSLLIAAAFSFIIFAGQFSAADDIFAAIFHYCLAAISMFSILRHCFHFLSFSIFRYHHIRYASFRHCSY
jgi:hypothetical protein